MNENLKEKFYHYRNHIFYDPEFFTEVFNNGMENQTFSKTYLTRFKYKQSQKNLSDEQIKNKLLFALYNKDFANYKILDKNLILTNNLYPYIVPKNYFTFIIWVLNPNINISYIKQVTKTYFSNYDYLIWRNPKFHQSVKLIKHYHLVLKKPTEKLILKKVLLVVRHGPREPIHLPKNFDKSYWSSNINKNIIIRSQNAKLTNLGKLYCEYRGKEAFNYYSREIDFANLSKKDFLIKSSYIERTRESSLHYMKSFGFDFTEKDIIISDFLAANKLLGLIDFFYYQMYQKKFNLNIDTHKLNKNLEIITGEKISNGLDIFHIYSSIKCYQVHDYNLPKNLDKFYDLIEKISVLEYNEVNQSKKNIYSRKIGKVMLENIFLILKTDKIFSYLSTHDNMIMSLLKYISYKYNLDIKLFDIPDFCSCVRFELWNDILRIYYDSLFLIEIKEY